MNHSWDDLTTQTAMVNTNMVLKCAPHLNNCTELKNTPGANIAFPVSMVLTGTIGNAIAIFVLHRNSRREQMRTVFYVLVGSLAWTDLAGIILTTIPVLAVYLKGRGAGGVGMCNYHAFTMIGIGLITPCIVCTMAVERYLGIRHGYFYKKHVNRSRVWLVLLAQWVFVLIYTSLPLFGFGQYAVQYPGTWCFLNLHPTSALDMAYSCIFAITILGLILVMIFCNIAVIATLIAMRYRRKQIHSPPRAERQIHRTPRQREIEIQMVVLLVGITVLFTSCWAPLMIQILLNQIVGHGDDHMQDLVVIRLVSINQTFDPWVYILFRKVIFTKFWKYLRGTCLGQMDPMVSDSKKTTAAHHLLQNGQGRPLQLLHNSVNQGKPSQRHLRTQHQYGLQAHRHHSISEMPPAAIGCRGLILHNSDGSDGPGSRIFQQGSSSNDNSDKAQAQQRKQQPEADFELSVNDAAEPDDGSSPVLNGGYRGLTSGLDDSALEIDGGEGPAKHTMGISGLGLDEEYVRGLEYRSMASGRLGIFLPTACPNCQRLNSLGDGGDRLNPLALESKSKSWTTYLDALPPVKIIDRMRERTANGPATSASALEVDLGAPSAGGSIRSAII